MEILKEHEKADDSQAQTSWPSAMLRGPWTVLCVAASVVVGPTAATASALDRANAAPPHHFADPHAPDAPEAAQWGRAAA
ncbi:hypothetical protein [Streptomyces himalayensis]|uniref:Uncharacterized protein n=1 Tax=Streptomyces himalayensis subsp. himalayensis TaxID=2756131 RepID=A0A7W0DNU8_9ACTN|nr:hypothetical protein [Streptomyces himalayensis]MBA2948533.1 hypothetical protein [Streptomyces himalayensis subsp. himalayensis]